MPVPEFVTELRSHVGTAPLWLSGVSAVVLDPSDRVLLGRRSDNGLWSVISGILDPGEQPAPAAVREVLEETGVVARVVALASVFSGGPVAYPNGDQAQYLSLTFLCEYVSGTARVADDESLDVGWFATDALPQPHSPSSADRIADALAARADPGTGPRFVR
ncbi:NUDIX domain-containing protein [Georgenia sp. MJ173]|uniref:NUDIX hydrolase n=1 Tax=Georgenia sunbinii TaxID=3117728 RepID=UPI002F26BE50